MWSKEQKYRHGLTHNPKFQLCRVFSRNDLVEKKFWNRRKKFLEFKEKLGLDPNKYNFDEQDIISALQLAFEGEIMNTQNCIQNKRHDLYFHEQNLAMEIGGYGHVDKNFENKQSRQMMIEKKRGCKYIRTNPDAVDFKLIG